VAERVELAFEGPLSPPRENGELQFAALWESRIFGLTMSLVEAGAFEWREFQQRLIDAIGAWERAHPGAPDNHYWERWLEAFERLVDAKGLASSTQQAARVSALTARPAGWDHAP
jgi:nitrile hydratase accessory protein